MAAVLMLLQIPKVFLHRLQHAMRLTQATQLLGHLPGFASLEPLPQLPVEPPSFLVGYRYMPQRQADVLRRMPEVQDEMPLLMAQPHTLGHPLQPLPNPRRPVGQEHHHLRTGGTEPLQVHRHQFHGFVRPTEGAVDPGAARSDLLAFLVDLVDDQQLDVTPVGLVTAALLLGSALAFLLARDAAEPALAGVDATGHARARQLLTGRHPALAVVEQVAFATRQDLRPQLGGDAADLLEWQVQAVGLQLTLGVLKGGQHGGSSGHEIDQGRGLAVVNLQDSQLRVQARASPTTAFAGVVDNGGVGGADPEDQATEQADAAGALLGRTKETIGLGYFFFAASCRAGWLATPARRPATNWSASWPKRRWTSCSKAAKQEGSWESISVQRCCCC